MINDKFCIFLKLTYIFLECIIQNKFLFNFFTLNGVSWFILDTSINYCIWWYLKGWNPRVSPTMILIIRRYRVSVFTAVLRVSVIANDQKGKLTFDCCCYWYDNDKNNWENVNVSTLSVWLDSVFSKSGIVNSIRSVCHSDFSMNNVRSKYIFMR